MKGREGFSPRQLGHLGFADVGVGPCALDVVVVEAGGQPWMSKTLGGGRGGADAVIDSPPVPNAAMAPVSALAT